MFFLHDLSDQDGIIYNGMKKAKLYKYLITVLFITAALGSCIDADYFTAYTDKNLASHVLLSEWNTSRTATYMKYEVVASTTAGTTGLPDKTADIYRLENINLMPNGDFEDTAVNTTPSGWTETGTAGAHQVKDSGHHLDGKALYFSDAESDYLSFALTNMSDTLENGSSYVFRFKLEGTATGAYYFSIKHFAGIGIEEVYQPTVGIKDTAYTVPFDLDLETTEFIIDSSKSEVFNINSSFTQTGYIDDLRIIRSDKELALIVSLPYEDVDRIDELALLSGTYRFSVYVKADPATSTTNNSFDSTAVSLKLEALYESESSESSGWVSFSASDYSSFADWTQIWVDTELQINIPYTTTDNVIRLSISPTDCSGAGTTVDAGSILISNPGLEYSSDGTF